MTTSPRVRLGPNHPDYAEPIAQPFYTLSQLLRQYGMEHDRRAGKACHCLLCDDLRLHVAAHKASRNGGRR
jgi:predicted adenine nucleotide alpha hydrolase (AANH) superfamily ATPase